MYLFQVIISGHYDYSDPIIQEQAENLTVTLESSKYISDEYLFTTSWLRSYLDYIKKKDLQGNLKNNETAFVKELMSYLSEDFALDVKIDESGERIIASRFLIQAVNVSGTNQEKDMVKQLRQICADSPLNASVFHPYFVFFDQFELVLPTSIQSMIYGAITMMIISFIFIPNVLCSFWVAFCIISIELGVAGYMSLWDVSLDSISMINLIMCIGFSVDFTAHICYAYMSSKKKLPEDRVKDCLYTLGLPIVQGALSTILGLVALLLAGTYIFLVFFKMVFLVIFIGAMHGLFLLPVLLSLFGPGSCTNFDEDEVEKKDSKEISKLPQPYTIPHPTFFYHNSMDAGPIINLNAMEEQDLGLGTSEDSNSTESNCSQSRRNKTLSEQENQNKTCYDDWKKSVGILRSFSQFQAPSPDYPRAIMPIEYRNCIFQEPRQSSRTTRASQYASDHKRSRSQHHLNQSHTFEYFSDPRFP